jgi:peptidase E
MKTKKPIYLLAGGNLRQAGTLKRQFQTILAETQVSAPRVAYVGAANRDSLFFYNFIRGWLKSAGAEVGRVVLAKAGADARRARAALRRADAIFISGGDVEEGMRWLNRHKLKAFLQDLYAEGTLFFGLSAGSIMLGTRWVRWEDDEDDATAELFECMGLAPVLCDTHGEGDGWEELIAAVRLLGPGGKGYGIPSGGALRISPSGRIAALEQPAVCYVNRGGRVVAAPKLNVTPA